MSYIEITRQELEDWLTSHFHKWSKQEKTEGIYLIHLSDRVGIKLASTQASTDTSMGRGQASMNLTLVSLVNGHVLNRKARDRKHFKRTTNWRKTWLKGVEYWMGIYNDNPDFYEKIADRDAYKAKWLEIIDSLPMGGNDPKVISARDTLEGGGVLWNGQEKYLLSLKGNASSQPVNTLSKPLPIEKLRDLYRKARKRGDLDALQLLTTLGQASGRGELPSLLDVLEFKKLQNQLS